MSVKFYDDAFVEKLNKWTNNTSITILGPEDSKRLFEIIADTSNDDTIKLPIISLKRKSGYEILNPLKKVMTFNGATIDAGKINKQQLNAIPISINYQIDIYTRYFNEADEYIRNLIFNIINYPKLSIMIPYLKRYYVHDSNIRLTPNVDDNSDIPERLISGQFTRMSLNVYIDDAYLWDIKLRPYYAITDIQVDPNPPSAISENSEEAEIITTSI